MSSKTAATGDTSASVDKVEVSFATDDEEEASSSSSSEDATSSSSESDEEAKSDGDGDDADDESEMPTFTLSLQPSTDANDVDDALPDLSRSPADLAKHETAAAVTETFSVSASETKIESVASESTISGTKLDSGASGVAEEASVTLSITTKGEAEKEPTEEAEESEEESADEDEEEEENVEEQHLDAGSTVTTSTSPPVSTQIDTKENSTVSSGKLSITETKVLVEKEKEEQVGLPVAAGETKTTSSTEKTAIKSDSVVTEVESKRALAKTVEEKTSKETVVEQVANIKIFADDNLPDLSKTKTAKAAKPDINDAASVSVSSVPKPDPQPSKKSMLDSMHDETKFESAKADSTETVVVDQVANLTIATEKNLPDLSKTTTTKAAKSDIANDAEVTLVSSVLKPDQQSSKKNKKDPAHDKAKLESAKVDTTSLSVKITNAGEIKQEDGVKETPVAPIESDKKTTKSTKLQKTSKGGDTSEVATKELSETVDSPKSSKNRKTKDEAKEDKQEVTSTVEEEQTASVTVVIKQSKDRLQSEEEVKTGRTITDADPKPKVNPEKKKEARNLDKTDKVGEATKVETTNKSEEATKDVTSDMGAETKTKNAEIAVDGSLNETEKTVGSETSEAKLSSKKQSKHSTEADKETGLKNVITDGPAVAKDLQRDGKKSAGKVSEQSVVVKTSDVPSSVTAAAEAGTPKSSINAAGSATAKNVTENRPDKDKSLPATSSGDADTKLNGVDDEGKLSLGDDMEFRPRRNSIDEFIKRILAEAREEQKKILDSCAVSPGGEETGASASLKPADGPPPSSKGTEPERPQQPVVNGVDVSLTAMRTAARKREDFDIDEELADISRIYAKRTLIDAANDEEFASTTGAGDSAPSKIVANGDERPPPTTSGEEVLHFVPQRREATTAVVRESSRPVRILMDQQASAIRQLTEVSRAVDELDNELRQLRQATGGRHALYASITDAIRDETRLYEAELAAAGERLGQQRLPGGGRFVREQFVSQCAEELLKRSTAAANRPRLERAATVDEWMRAGRRGSGSVSVDEDVGGGSWSAVKPWTTDLMIQLRHSRSGSVVSDRGYSSFDTVDESRGATPSSLLSRVSILNGSTTVAELDFGRSSRASSEAPRSSHFRSQPPSDSDWPSATYSVGRQYVRYGRGESAEDTTGDLEVGYHRVGARPPPGQPAETSYRRYQPPSLDSPASPQSRLYVRRGSLQSYGSSHDGGSSDVGRSFNSRFLSRVREKKALGESATTRQTTADRPFRSRFLKSSSGSATYSSSRSYDSDDN